MVCRYVTTYVAVTSNYDTTDVILFTNFHNQENK